MLYCGNIRSCVVKPTNGRMSGVYAHLWRTGHRSIKMAFFLLLMYLRRPAILSIALWIGVGLGQSATVSLGSGSAQPGSSVSVPISFTGGTTLAAGVMWTFAYVPADITAISVTAGAVATAAGKSINCRATSSGRHACVAVGVNKTAIATGTLATARFTLASNTSATSTSIQVLNALAASPTGTAVVVTGSPATVTIVRPVALSAISCSPTVITLSASSSCTISLTAPAPSGGFAVSLGSILSGGTISMPSSVTIPAGSKTAQFTVKLLSIIIAGTLQVTARAGGVTKDGRPYYVRKGADLSCN